MAIYDNLPVYKTSYELLIELFKLVKNFSREWKFTIGEEIKKETIEMILNIYRANSSWEKKEKIQKARENIETIRMMLRLLKDLKQMGLDRFININEKIESVSKQLAAWEKTSK